MTTTATRKPVKEVTITSRIEFKADSKKVVYIVLASNQVDKYEVHMYDGKACSCTCPSTRGCYHRTGCEAREVARLQADEDECPGLDQAEAYIVSLKSEQARHNAPLNNNNRNFSLMR